MKARSRFPLVLPAALAAALSAGCSGGPGSQAAGGAEGQAAPAVPVQVGRVTREAVPVEVHAIGTVTSRSTVEIKAQVGGEVTAVHFREGQDVTKGQPLFTIDPRPYQAAVQEAEARLARDRALAVKSEADVERYADLVEKDYVTREQYDQIRANAESQRATVKADEAALEQARLELGWTTLAAPVSGRTGKLLVHAGNVVKANDLPLVVIQQVEPVDVAFSVAQSYLDEVRARSAAGELTATAAPPGGAAHDGALTFIDNAVDPATGTIALKATFPNRDRALWPGQFVNVTLDLAMEQDAVVAPAPAVQTGQEGAYVFVVQGDGTVESQSVEVSRTVGQKAVIAHGLSGGETVVTDGQLRLVPGAKVEPQTAEAAGGPAAPAGQPGSAAAEEGSP
jgi:multidrug efflux system membrane fusion protein